MAVSCQLYVPAAVNRQEYYWYKIQLVAASISKAIERLKELGQL
jgi:hypothetical protein